MRTHLQRLQHLFSHEDRLLILIDPDPDAIASALALKRLLWRRLTACVIAPIRPITRSQNKRLVQVLGISLTPLNELNPHDFNRKALVDGQPAHNELFGGHRYDVIIDHHPRHPETRAQLADIVSITKSVHSYEVPEIIALPVIGGSAEYFSWLDKELNTD